MSQRELQRGRDLIQAMVQAQVPTARRQGPNSGLPDRVAGFLTLHWAWWCIPTVSVL